MLSALKIDILSEEIMCFKFFHEVHDYVCTYCMYEVCELGSYYLFIHFVGKVQTLVQNPKYFQNCFFQLASLVTNWRLHIEKVSDPGKSVESSGVTLFVIHNVY